MKNGDVIMMTVVVALFLILIILKQVRYIKELKLPTRKGAAEIITVIIGVGVLILITYKYANTMSHYFIGILGIILLLTSWLKEGITSKGFTSNYKYKEVILWSEIEKINIVNNKKYFKITLSGGFMQQSFKFKSEDFNKVKKILKDNGVIC